MTCCKSCRRETELLVHDPNDPLNPRRTVCGACAGDANRRVLDSLNRRGDRPPTSEPRRDHVDEHRGHA